MRLVLIEGVSDVLGAELVGRVDSTQGKTLKLCTDDMLSADSTW